MNQRLLLLALLAASLLAGRRVAHSADADISQIRRIIASRGDDAAAPAQLVQLTRDLEPDVAAELFDQIAADHYRSGLVGTAAQFRKLLIEKYPDQPPANRAVLWLTRMLCSSELAHFQARPQIPTTQNREWAATADPTSPTTQPPARRVDSSVLFAALHLADDAVDAQPSLADNPALAFQRAVAARLRGQSKIAVGWLTPLKHDKKSEPWRSRGLAEAWLTDRERSAPPLGLIYCVTARNPPLLDGEFDELMWQTVEPVPIESASSPAEARFAYDAEYLYLAIRAAKLPGLEYAADDGPRPQDGADNSRDHIHLRLDLDRDYATCFNLSVDYRGWTADAVWGMKQWDPQWFVAAADSPQAWGIEAAIPWSELTSLPPQAGDAWAASVERRLPNGTETSGGAYRLLLFE